MNPTPSTNITWHTGRLTRDERNEALGISGATVWLTGLSGSGKSTLACELEQRLVRAGRPAYRLDGDNLRTGLNGDLGFTREDREENCRRVGEVARLLADAGLIAIAAVISPYADSRRRVRELHAKAGLRFVEVYLAATADCCAARDPKGLYAKAAAGEIGSFTGVDDPYEVPEHPDLVIGNETPVDQSVEMVLGVLGPSAS
jgi:bifunctional enzyme CysN/CysC